MILLTEVLNESKASDQAKKMGLDYLKFGRYGKDGKVTHMSQGDKLVPIPKQGKVHGKPKPTNTFNKKKQNLGPAAMAGDYDSYEDNGDSPQITPNINKKSNRSIDNKWYDDETAERGRFEKEQTPQSKLLTTKNIANNPRIQNVITNFLNTTNIRHGGYSGEWDYNPNLKMFAFDDQEGGLDYYNEIRPVPGKQDTWSVGVIDNRSDRNYPPPKIIKGLKNVKTYLELETT